MTSGEPWALSASEALTKFRSKDLSPVEYLTSQIGRITSEDERINAVTEVVEEAVTSAREAEGSTHTHRMMSSPRRPPPGHCSACP